MKKLLALFITSIFVVLQLSVAVPASAATTVSITSPTSGSTETGTSFTVTGTATADRKITVSVNGDEVGTTTSDGSGDWSLEVTGQDAGAKTITAVASVHYAYVPNSAAATISVINTDTDQKVGSDISSGVNQSNTVVRSDGAQMVTAGGVGSDQVRVWDLSDPAVPAITDSITSAHASTIGLDYTPDGTEFWTTSTSFAAGTIRSYDSTTPATTADITGYTGTIPISIQFNAAGDKAYVSDCSDSAVHVIDVATKAQTSTIAGVGCGGIVVGPNDVAILLDSNNDRVKPVNIAAETAGSYIGVGDSPAAILFNEDGSRAYVTNVTSNNISVINTDSNAVIDTISLTGGPKAGMFNADRSKAYIARSTADEVVVTDGSTFSELSAITVGDSPAGVIAGPSESSTTSVDFTLAVATSSSSEDVLADTGQNSHIYMALASVLLISPAVYLRKRYIRR